MKSRQVVFRPEAEADLLAMYQYIAAASGSFDVAFNFTERMRAACQTLSDFSERGRLRDDIAEGMRILIVERRAVIAYFAKDDHVTINNIFHAGRDWETTLQSDDYLFSST